MLLYYISSIIFLFLALNMFNLSIFYMIFKFNMFIEWNSLFINSMSINMYMYIDWMTLMFTFTVMMISSMIMLYSIEYMNHDMYNIRFFWILLFFIMSMMLMILSPNILTILIGWDGLGLTSYCLIIYYQSNSSFNSGMLTVMINRLGDIFIIMSISLMLISGSWNLLNIENLKYYIIIYIMLAAFTKSAQYPFSSWLPAAMAAPTPVSSLVHSSTLVTAGIYMMIRFFNLFKFNSVLLKTMMYIGLITMLMAGLSAIFEYDLKKIIAYSTLSQLGLMMMILGFKYPELSFFHLIIHAMFKSMMFMCSGIIIHSMNNCQDIRFMGKIKNIMPMTSLMLLISNYSLCGMPFFSGFYSKDMILENIFLSKSNFMIYMMLLISTMLTVMYSTRLMYYMMNNKLNFYPLMNYMEYKIMNYPMIILMIMSILFGMYMNWIIYNNIENIFLLKIEKLMILLICSMGFILGILFYKILNMINKMIFIKIFLGKMWFLYNFNYLIIIKILELGKLYSLIFDKGWSEEIFKINIIMMNKNLYMLNMLNFNYLIYLIMMMTYLYMMMLMLI